MQLVFDTCRAEIQAETRIAGSACHETAAHSAAATNLIEDIPGSIGFALTLALYINTYAKNS